jgi:hypothetical protein
MVSPALFPRPDIELAGSRVFDRHFVGFAGGPVGEVPALYALDNLAIRWPKLIYAARVSAENVARVTDTVVPSGPAKVSNWAPS